MSRVIQPVALCVVLLLGALPAATAACQWACATTTKLALHHDMHDHSRGASASPGTTPDGHALVASRQRCDHAGAVMAAVRSTGLQVLAPAAVDVAGIEVGAGPHVAAAAVVFAAHSPPGARSGALSLRI